MLGGGRSVLEMIRAGAHLSGGTAFPNQPHLEAPAELGWCGQGEGQGAGAEEKEKLPQGSRIFNTETFLNGSITSSLIFQQLILPRSGPTVLIKIKSGP